MLLSKFATEIEDASAFFVWPNSCSLALQVIFKPRLVRAEWGSIEAMSGADDEDTAGGRVWTHLGEIGEMLGSFETVVAHLKDLVLQ